MRLDKCNKCGYIVKHNQRYKIVEKPWDAEPPYHAVEHIDCTDPTKGVAEKLAVGKRTPKLTWSKY